MSTLEEKKHHEVKLREGLGDLSVKRMELQNALSSSWPKQVCDIFFSIIAFDYMYIIVLSGPH